MIEKLFKKTLLLLGMFVAVAALNNTAMAQDDEVTDEELKLYATVMNKIDSMKTDMQEKYNEMIKSEETMDGGRRFKELKKANGDETKLAEINATEEEIAAYNAIQEGYEKLVSDFKTAYPTLIKDELGAAVYNKVKKALKADEELKEKYEAIVESLKPQEDEEAEEGDA